MTVYGFVVQVSKHMASRHALQADTAKHGCHFHVVPRAAQEHQRLVAARLRLPVRDVCFFFQLPFRISGSMHALSFSTGECLCHCCDVLCGVPAINSLLCLFYLAIS